MSMNLKFSQDLEALLQRSAQSPVTLADVLAETSERGFSLVIGLLVLPFLLPMPPGFSSILGSACLLLSLQMALGRRSPWLPGHISRFRFPQSFSVSLLVQLKRVSGWLEKLVRPRFLTIAESPIIWNINGLCMAWLTILLMLPIPFTNPIPTLGILLLAIATLEADGLLMCICYVFTALITALLGVLAYGLWQAPTLLQALV